MCTEAATGTRWGLAPALCRLVADSLDVVAVRIEHISAVVVGVVDGANAWCAIVDSASDECRGVERIDLTAAVSGQGDVQPPPYRCALRLYPEPGFSGRAKPRRLAGRLHDQCQPQRREGVFVEGLAAVIVADGKSDVVEHHLVLRR